MKLEQSFEVRAGIDQVWVTLVEVEGVASCLPGAEITGAADGGGYHGTFTVKLGPATASYDGILTLERVDEPGRTVVIHAGGQDKRGQGSARATIESRVSGDSSASRVDVVTDFTITGRLARVGRGGMMQDVANRLLEDFARCLEARIAAQSQPVASPPATEPADGAAGQHPPAGAAGEPVRGLTLIAAVLAQRVKRLMARLRSWWTARSERGHGS